MKLTDVEINDARVVELHDGWKNQDPAMLELWKEAIDEFTPSIALNLTMQCLSPNGRGFSQGFIFCWVMIRDAMQRMENKPSVDELEKLYNTPSN